MRRKVVVGSRGSRLAMTQTRWVAARLQEVFPDLDISITEITTTGDRDRNTSLEKLGTAVFVKELEAALLDNRIDIAVHSLKDMPTELPGGLELLAVCERSDPRDVLVSRSRLEDLPAGSGIGTDSSRRLVQIVGMRPDVNVRGIRGNVDTRLRKVQSGEMDAVVLAAAGLQRLGWADRITQYLPVEVFLPAVGQGALAVEGRAGDGDVAAILAPIHDFPTWHSVIAERAFLRTLGGGCRAPVAALGNVDKSGLKLAGMVGSVRQRKMIRASDQGTADSAEQIGVRLAHRLLEMGASEFIAEVESENR